VNILKSPHLYFSFPEGQFFAPSDVSPAGQFFILQAQAGIGFG
jgi:hypothetical protein